MTKDTDALREAVSDLIRPVIGIDCRSAEEVHAIMCDRIKHKFAALTAPSTDPDTIGSHFGNGGGFDPVAKGPCAVCGGGEGYCQHGPFNDDWHKYQPSSPGICGRPPPSATKGTTIMSERDAIVAVTEADREAYLSLNMLPEFDAADVRAGRWDKVAGLQAFARHRATHAGEVERLREALEWYRDQLCEGFCEGFTPRICKAAMEENPTGGDCSGCRAVIALAALKGPAA